MNRELAEEIRGIVDRLQLPLKEQPQSGEITNAAKELVYDPYEGWYRPSDKEIMNLLNNLPTIIEALEK